MVNCFAQSHFGIATGINFTNRQDNNQSEVKNGWQGGIFLAQALNDKILLQPSLLYSAKNYFVYSQVSKEKLNFHYINLPILFGYKVSKRITLFAGPEFCYLAKAQLKRTANDKLDISSDYKTFFEALTFQASYKVFERIGFDLSYHYGINNLKKQPSASKFLDRNVQFGLFYFFK